AIHEISRALRGTSNAAELRHALGLHTHFIHRVNDAFGNRVMPAPGTERSLPAAVVNDLQTDAVGLRSRSGCRSVCRCRPHLLALSHHEFVGHGPRVNRQSMDMATRPYTLRQSRPNRRL